MTTELFDLLHQHGAALVGCGDLRAIEPEKRKDLPFGLSIAVAVDPRIILGLSEGPTAAYYEEYKRLNALLDQLDEMAAEFLTARGYHAFAKTRSTVEIDGSVHRTELPHKTVATRAGLGWIGNCALLVTESYGSAVRISTVLTDAPLRLSEPVNASKCGSCTVCRDICPAGAVSGRNWALDLDRDGFYDAHACRKTARERSGKAGIDESLCGLCILRCPWTQKYLAKSAEKEPGKK